jgi:phage terminase large subunit GpA-like protein
MKNHKIENIDSLPAPLPLQPEELEILSPRKKLTVSEWALANRKLSPKTSNYDGPWSHEITPWAVEIMDSLSDVGTRQVTVEKSAQSCGTEIGLNFLAWIIDESPGPTGIFMPREDDTNRRVNTRIKPMFQSTASLRQHLPSGKLESINTGKESVLDDMIMFIGWAGSAAALADNPLCYIWLDEVGKFPPKIGKEADPVSLAKDRQITFFARSKLYVVSTPVKENDLIDREFKAGDKRKWWVKCSFCGEYHIMRWANVQLDKNSDGNLLNPQEYTAGRHARYICPGCKKAWNEQNRWQAVSNGRWAPEGCIINKNGRIAGQIPVSIHRSYHISALMLYPGFQTVDRLAAKWADAQIYKRIGDIGPLQDFINSQLGEPFEEREKETDESVLIKHIDNYKPETVPAGVQMITAGLDVQLDHVWFYIVGWGYMSEAWSITEGRLETGDTSLLENYKLVEELLQMAWPLKENPSIKGGIYRAAIDCAYRTDVIYDLCRRHGDVLIPVRGDDFVKNKIFRATKVAGMTLIRYDLNTNALKDRLYRLLYESIAAGPGYFHLHAETTGETLQQLASEEQRPIRIGRHFYKNWFRKDRLNHLWDCATYATFAAELSGARTLRELTATKPVERKMEIKSQEGQTKKIRTQY